MFKYLVDYISLLFWVPFITSRWCTSWAIIIGMFSQMAFFMRNVNGLKKCSDLNR